MNFFSHIVRFVDNSKKTAQTQSECRICEILDDLFICTNINWIYVYAY